MDAIDFLASSNFIMVNRGLMLTIGLNESLVLGELASEYRYWRGENKLQDGKWFFSTDDNLTSRLPFSTPTIRRAISSLKELGILETKLMGVPAKRFFCIHVDKIPGCSNFTNLGPSNFSTKNKEEEKEVKEISVQPQAAQDDGNEKLEHMKPTALRQQLATIFRTTDKTKTRSLIAVRRLQEQFDDDSIILDAARKMKARGEIEIGGIMWKPDYFWFVNPDKTDSVVKGIIHVMKKSLVEMEIPEGLREQYDIAIELGEAESYEECEENWGMILPRIKFTKEYERLTNGR